MLESWPHGQLSCDSEGDLKDRCLKNPGLRNIWQMAIVPRSWWAKCLTLIRQNSSRLPWSGLVACSQEVIFRKIVSLLTMGLPGTPETGEGPCHHSVPVEGTLHSRLQSMESPSGRDRRAQREHGVFSWGRSSGRLFCQNASPEYN